MFTKSSVRDLRIFSTTRLANNVSLILASWFTIISTWVMYLVTPFVSFIFMLSNSPLSVWSRTYFPRSSHYTPSPKCPTLLLKIWYLQFSQSQTSSKFGTKYKVALSFVHAFWAFDQFLVFSGFTWPFSTTSQSSWEPRRAFILRLQLSKLTAFVNLGRGRLFVRLDISLSLFFQTLKHSIGSFFFTQTLKLSGSWYQFVDNSLFLLWKNLIYLLLLLLMQSIIEFIGSQFSDCCT